MLESFPRWPYCSLPRTVVILSCPPIICYMEDSSIFISWLTHRYWFLPRLLFTATACFIFFVTGSNWYCNIRDYHNLDLPAILNYNTSFFVDSRTDNERFHHHKTSTTVLEKQRKPGTNYFDSIAEFEHSGKMQMFTKQISLHWISKAHYVLLF